MPAEEPTEASRALESDGPLLFFSRHAGPGDTILLIDRLLTRFDRLPSVVFKQGLAVGSVCRSDRASPPARGPRRFREGRVSEARIEEVAAGLARRGVLVLFPEGGNVTPERRRRAIRKLWRTGRRREAGKAERMSHVLPPRPPAHSPLCAATRKPCRLRCSLGSGPRRVPLTFSRARSGTSRRSGRRSTRECGSRSPPSGHSILTHGSPGSMTGGSDSTIGSKTKEPSCSQHTDSDAVGLRSRSDAPTRHNRLDRAKQLPDSRRLAPKPPTLSMAPTLALRSPRSAGFLDPSEEHARRAPDAASAARWSGSRPRATSSSAATISDDSSLRSAPRLRLSGRMTARR